jgi:glyoxylase-like metal-dependent hydrolase (beta-lactamase superfamily II)
MLPTTVHVLVRDWLNANHILFLGPDENVLVDAGHVSGIDETLRRVREALDGRPLHRLLNTHCHSDHMGGNAAVQRAFGCPIHVPEGESDAIARWDTDALWLDFAGQVAERFTFDAVTRPGDTLALGGFDWQAIAAPGHDMGALMFWCEAERILISGDALWARGFGVVLPGDGIDERLAAARETLHVIRDLRPQVVIPGHGEPFTEVDGAVDACLSRVAAFEADERKLARHVLKVMLVFSMLERGGFREDALDGFVAATPMYADYDAAWFQIGAVALGRAITEELIASGALRREDGWLRPA